MAYLPDSAELATFDFALSSEPSNMKRVVTAEFYGRFSCYPIFRHETIVPSVMLVAIHFSLFRHTITSITSVEFDVKLVKPLAHCNESGE